MQIVSQIKVNGEWINQELIPGDIVAKIVEETIRNAGKVTGFEVTKKKKTA